MIIRIRTIMVLFNLVFIFPFYSLCLCDIFMKSKCFNLKEQKQKWNEVITCVSRCMLKWDKLKWKWVKFFGYLTNIFNPYLIYQVYYTYMYSSSTAQLDSNLSPKILILLRIKVHIHRSGNVAFQFLKF